MTAANPDRWAAPNYASFTGTDATPLQQTFQSLSAYLEKINNSVTIASGTGVTTAVAGTGISVSSATGAVTFANTGVTSLVAGTNITLSGSTGAVTINAAGGGVTSLTGTANKVTVSASTGSVTLSLPADVTLTTSLTVASNSTVTSGGFYSVGSATLNRASGASFTSAGVVNLQQDGSTYAAIGSNSAQYGHIAVNMTYRNGWAGFNFGGSSASGTPHFMFSTSNDGGHYHYGHWATFWSMSNLCLGIGDSTTTAGYKLQVNGALKGTSVIDSGGRYRSLYMPNIAAELQMRSGNATSFNWNGSYQFIVDTTHVKTFTIQHPTKPDNLLVHACTEGPTADVFYRGQAQLKAGICVVTLPDYFEELTELENRSVMLTPIADENGMVANLAAYEIEDGQFLVEQIGGYHVPDQRFWWRVDAVRKNTAFNVEPEKSSVTVRGDGPYTYVESNS